METNRPMPDLKLIALDSEDLSVISAHFQDAVFRVADMAYLPREKRFAAVGNRFDWAVTIKDAAKSKKPGFERRRSGLRIDRVLDAKVQGVALKEPSQTLALLAIGFEPGPDPDGVEGHVTLTFSGGAAIRLMVECLEVEMRDLGGAWRARQSPVHPDDEHN